MSDRFYTPKPLQLGDFTLEGHEAHHLAHVRRFQVGDEVTLFNGDGREYSARVIEAAKKWVTLAIDRIGEPQRELGIVLHLAVALPKGDRSDFLIEKLTELGVTDFTPLLAARSVVQPGADKVEKLQRAVIEASKQCGRNVLMRAHPPLPLAAWCRLESLPPRKWIAHPDGLPPPVAAMQAGVAAAIGPEGGFTEDELKTAGEHGFERIRLGPRILRVETAAVALASLVGLNQVG